MAIKTSKSFMDAAPQVVQDDNKLPAQKVGRRRTMTLYLTENHYTYLKQLKQEKMIASERCWTSIWKKIPCKRRYAIWKSPVTMNGILP